MHTESSHAQPQSAAVKASAVQVRPGMAWWRRWTEARRRARTGSRPATTDTLPVSMAAALAAPALPLEAEALDSDLLRRLREAGL